MWRLSVPLLTSKDSLQVRIPCPEWWAVLSAQVCAVLQHHIAELSLLEVQGGLLADAAKIVPVIQALAW